MANDSFKEDSFKEDSSEDSFIEDSFVADEPVKKKVQSVFYPEQANLSKDYAPIVKPQTSTSVSVTPKSVSSPTNKSFSQILKESGFGYKVPELEDFNKPQVESQFKIYEEKVKKDPTIITKQIQEDKKRKKEENSIYNAQQVVQKAPNRNNYFLLGNEYLNSGNYEKAIEAFDNASLYPQTQKEYTLSQEEAYAQQPASGDDNLAYSIANAYDKMGKKDEAMRMYKVALKKNPNNVEANKALAYEAYKKGDKKLSDFHIDKAHFEESKRIPAQPERIGESEYEKSKEAQANTILQAAEGIILGKDPMNQLTLISPVAFVKGYVQGGIDGVKEGSKEIAESIKLFSETTPVSLAGGEAKEGSLVDKKLLAGAKFINGGIKLGFAYLQAVDPVVFAAWHEGNAIGEAILPSKVVELVMTPASYFAKGSNDGELKKTVLSSIDTFANLALFHQFTNLAKKIKTNESLTPKEQIQMVKMIETAKPEEIQRAVEKTKETEDIDSRKKELENLILSKEDLVKNIGEGQSPIEIAEKSVIKEKIEKEISDHKEELKNIVKNQIDKSISEQVNLQQQVGKGAEPETIGTETEEVIAPTGEAVIDKKVEVPAEITWQSEQETIDSDTNLTPEKKQQKKVENTAKALEGTRLASIEALLLGEIAVGKIEGKTPNQVVSEAYHSDKAAGKETELTKAVEELLGKPTEKTEEVKREEQPIKQKQNEKEPIKTENVKPLSEGVSGIRTEGEAGQESPKLRAEEEIKPVEPKEGDKITIAPQIKGGMERTMVFEDGEWKQSVSGETSRVSKKAQEDAQAAFESKAAPVEKTQPTEKEAKKAKLKEGLSRFKAETQEAVDAADKVAQSLKSAGIKVEVIDNQADVDKLSQRRGIDSDFQGVFFSDKNNGIIYLNRTKLNGKWGKTIVWHEGTHPILNIIKNTNPKLYNSLLKGVEIAKQNKANKLQGAVDWAKENYEKDGQDTVNDELLTEIIARIANNQIKLQDLPKTLKQQFIDFINELAKALGLKPVLSDTDYVALQKLSAQISDVLKSGRDISEIVGKENVENYESNFIIGTNNGQFKVSSSKKTDKKLNKKEKVSRPFDEKLIEFTDVDIYDGKKAVGFLGDKQIVGNAESPTGVTLEGKGGGLYPVWANKEALKQLKNNVISVIKKGKVWATTDLKGAKRLLNALKNGSLAAIGTQASEGILGNKMMLEHYSNLLEKSLSDYDKIIKENESKDKVKDAENSKRELIAAINNPLNTNFKPNLTYRDKIIDSLERIKQSKDSTPTQKKNAEKSLGVLKNRDFDSIQELYDAMYDLSYEVRTGFFTKVFNITNSNKFNLPSITKGAKYKYDQTILDYANDPLFKDAEYGDIVGFVEYDPNTLTIEKTEEVDEFHHKSYHYTIVGDIKSIKYLNNVLDGRSIFYESKPKTEAEGINQEIFGKRQKAQAARGIMGAMPSSEISAERVKERQDIYKKGGIPQKSKGQREEVFLPNGQKGRAIMSDVVDGFYSNTENALAQVKQEKMSGNQWKQQLLSRGAKAEEMKWTTLADFLEANKDKSITKSDIAQYLKDNRVQIVEVVKGRNDVTPSGVTDEGEFDYSGNTKFSPYQLEGDKENYKEVLITMPKNQVEGRFEVKSEKANGLIQYGVWDNVANKWKTEPFTNNRESAEVDIKRQQKQEGVDFKSIHFNEPNILVHLRMNTRTDAEGNKVLFLEEVQSDWGQQGKKEGFSQPADILLINQLEKEKQTILNSSKSYQLLNNKTEGDLSLEVFDAIQQEATNMIDNPYSTDKSRKENFLKNIDKTLNYWSSYNSVPKLNQKELSNFYDIYIQELKDNDIKIKGYGSSYRLASIENKVKEINEKISDAQEKTRTPLAPFVTDTNAWVKLGLKAALKEAVAQGVDRLAWSTGTQQFDRWGTEKIDWVKTKSGWNINIQEQFKGTAFEGMNIDEKALSEKGVTINSKQDLKDAIDRTLSREKNEQERQKLTDRIWERMQKEDKGTSLPRKEGMESFYGVSSEGNKGIVGKVAEALVKELTGQEGVIGETEIETDKNTLLNESYTDEQPDGQYKVWNGQLRKWEYDLTKDAADNRVENLNKKYVKKNTSTQHSIEITPELKAEVERGLPQFSKSGKESELVNFIGESLKDFTEEEISEQLQEELGYTKQEADRLISESKKLSETKQEINKYIEDGTITQQQAEDFINSTESISERPVATEGSTVGTEGGAEATVGKTKELPTEKAREGKDREGSFEGDNEVDTNLLSKFDEINKLAELSEKEGLSKAEKTKFKELIDSDPSVKEVHYKWKEITDKLIESGDLIKSKGCP